MENITLYSTGCPQCTVLKKKLDAAGIKYNLVMDQDIMIELGFKSAPILSVGGYYYTFTEAIRWVKEQQNNGN